MKAAKRRQDTSLATFGQTASTLSRSPLGIIALFIVMLYGFASVVLWFGARTLTQPEERLPLVWFLVLFPVVVLFVFAWLVSRHHEKLYAPGDFKDERLFLELRRKLAILEEVAPVAIARPEATPTRSIPAPIAADDPQKGRWGGRREARYRLIRAQPIRALRSDAEYYRIVLEVSSTDPVNHPLRGSVRFHLHDTFDPDVETVEARDGVARLEVVAWGAFTVGAETEDGVTLELDLSDADIDAPADFKAR